MTDPITPRQLAAELGVSDRTIRRWLEAQGRHPYAYAYFRLTEEEAEEVREYFRTHRRGVRKKPAPEE